MNEDASLDCTDSDLLVQSSGSTLKIAQPLCGFRASSVTRAIGYEMHARAHGEINAYILSSFLGSQAAEGGETHVTCLSLSCV